MANAVFVYALDFESVIFHCVRWMRWRLIHSIGLVSNLRLLRYVRIFFFASCVLFNSDSLGSRTVWNSIDHTRLRQESELLSRSSSQHWSQSDLQSYASTTNIADNDAALVQCTDSLSSTETLKWLGSMSDISSSSHATNTSHISASGNYYHSSSLKYIQFFFRSLLLLLLLNCRHNTSCCVLFFFYFEFLWPNLSQPQFRRCAIL